MCILDIFLLLVWKMIRLKQNLKTDQCLKKSCSVLPYINIHIIVFVLLLFSSHIQGELINENVLVLTNLNTGYGVGFTITQWTDFKFMLLFNVTWIRRQQSTKISFWTRWTNSTRWEHDHRENWLPWWKNSSVTFSLHRLLSFHGLHGLQISAHFRAIWNTRQFGFKCPKADISNVLF